MERGRALIFCWELWNARLKHCSTGFVRKDIFMFERWRKARERVLFRSVNSWQMTEGSKLWSKPGLNKFKVNIDAAIFKKNMILEGLFGTIQEVLYLPSGG